MAPVPELYSRAKDHVGFTPDIFRHISDPTSNMVAWQRNPITDMSTELLAYKRSLRDLNPEASGITFPQDISFNNGEKLVLHFDQAIMLPGYEHLKTEIQKIANALIDSVGLPVTFYPSVAEGRGQSSLRFLSQQGIIEQIRTPSEGDIFHLDGLQSAAPKFSRDSPERPSVHVTIITDILDSPRTRVIKADYVAPVVEAFERKLHEAMRNLPDPDSKLPTGLWDDAIEEVTRRIDQPVHRDLEPNEIAAFATMPRDMGAQNLFNTEPTRVVGIHSGPILKNDSNSRLTLVLRAQIGGFTPK